MTVLSSNKGSNQLILLIPQPFTKFLRRHITVLAAFLRYKKSNCQKAMSRSVNGSLSQTTYCCFLQILLIINYKHCHVFLKHFISSSACWQLSSAICIVSSVSKLDYNVLRGKISGPRSPCQASWWGIDRGLAMLSVPGCCGQRWLCFFTAGHGSLL